MNITMTKEAMNAFAEGYAEESVRQFKAKEKTKEAVNKSLGNDTKWVCSTASRFSHDVNNFGFNAKNYVDAMTGEEFADFVSVASVFVSLMAKKPYTDGRNEAAKARCLEYIQSGHLELDSPAEKKVAPGTGMYEKYVRNSEWDVRELLGGKFGGCTKEEAVALLMYHDHPTLQQTFAKACLYALMKHHGETDLIESREWSLPFI